MDSKEKLKKFGSPPNSVLVAGGVGLETKIFFQDNTCLKIADSPGGSGWLAALAANALGLTVKLVSSVGSDSVSHLLKPKPANLGLMPCLKV
jgi:sugar/nucleoside kinase (ribokinase family)